MASDNAATPASTLGGCPDCGAVNTPPAIFCWLCGRVLPQAGEEEPRPVPPNANFTFSLSSLMLVMTLIAVCLGAATIEPGFGIILAIAATPAVLRSMVLMKWERQRLGRSAGILDKVRTFLSSLFLIALVATASFAAFFAMCTAGFFAEFGGIFGPDRYGGAVFVTCIGVGIVASLVVLFFGVRWIWPRKDGSRVAESSGRDS